MAQKIYPKSMISDFIFFKIKLFNQRIIFLLW